MPKFSTYLLVFFVALNAWAGVLQASGVDALLGIDAETGGDDAYDRFDESETRDIDTGTGTGDTLFGMYNVLTGVVGGFYDAIFPGLEMLNRMGVPSYITHGFIGNLVSVIVIFNLISFLKGTDL